MRIRPGIISLSTAAMIALSLVGCSHDTSIPGSAKVVRSGEGRYGYIAEENGSVYVRDSGTKEQIATAHVLRGDLVYVEPAKDDIQVAGKAVAHKKPMDPEHFYEVYFDRAQ